MGFDFVSTRGPSGVGSGKSGTPLSRTHWANLRRAVVCWGVTLVPVNPGGSSSLQALRACSKAAELVSTAEPSATPSMLNSPDVFGSGNLLTPLTRMHSANFTAFSRVVEVLLPLPAPAGVATVLVPPLLRVLPHPRRLQRPLRPSQGRPAAAGVLYSSFLPSCADCIGTGSLPSVHSGQGSWRRGWLR